MQGADVSVVTSRQILATSASQNQDNPLSFQSQVDQNKASENLQAQHQISEVQTLAQELVSRHGLEASLRLIGELVRECRQLMRSHGPRPRKRPTPQ